MNRRYFLKRSAIAAGALAFPGMWAPPARAARPKNLIVSMDQGKDVDDPSDLAKVCAMARRYDFKLLAAMSSFNTGYSCPVLKAIIDYYQIPGVVYGKYTGSGVVSAITDVWGAGLSAQFGTGTDSSFPTQASQQYQNVLNALPSGEKATIIMTGYATDVVAFMNAIGSPYQLIQDKVEELIWVSGYLPGPTNEPNNVNNAVADAKTLADTWNNGWSTQVPFTWCPIGIGDSGLWDRPPVGDSDTVSPVRFAFTHPEGTDLDASGAKPAGYRWSWSWLGILRAAFPDVYDSFAGINGKVDITGTGYPSTSTTTWNSGINRNQRYLQIKSGVTTTQLNAMADWYLNLPRGASAPFPRGLILRNNLTGGNATTLKF